MCRNAHDFFVVSDTLITFMACNINDKLMTVTDRFLKYVTFDTESSETTGVTPSTPGQRVFAEALVKELEEIGLEDITLDDKSYLMATLPANTAKEVPTIGFIAHLDTSPDMSGKDVEPRIVSYEGGDIVLCAEENVVLSPLMFPELDDYKGQDIIVTNGKTLLGADDKGGVAAIIAAMKYLKDHPEVEHGKIRVGFTPDEEIGAGADYFDVEKFGCEWAYTIDGGQIGELEYENFNAAGAKVVFKGLNVHPGYAKDKMLNASLLAVEFASWLPVAQRPEHTTGYEGFFHLMEMTGTVEETKMSYLIRDFNSESYENRKELLRNITEIVNKKYGEGTVELKLNDSYRNMREKIEPCMELIEYAKKACEMAEVKADIAPIRGGTDGARLSFVGLPCPNLGTGGHAFHGPYEHISVEGMEKSVELLLALIQEYTK